MITHHEGAMIYRKGVMINRKGAENAKVDIGMRIPELTTGTNACKADTGAVGRAENAKDIFIYSSFRRKPESRVLKRLDPGLRRDDDKAFNRSLSRNFLGGLCAFAVNQCAFAVRPYT
jgi:hypothetical protein